MRVHVGRVNAKVTPTEAEDPGGTAPVDRLVDAVAERVYRMIAQAEQAERDRRLTPDVSNDDERW